MKKIYDFRSFNKIYEAEEKSQKPYESLLKQILSYLNTCYMSQLKLTAEPYDSKIMGDLDTVAKTPGVDSYKKILDNVKGAVDTESPEAKAASEAWNASAEKILGALGKLIEKLPDAKDNINKIITDFINLQKQNLANASKENKLKPEGTKKNESYSFEFESVNEGILTTKKSLFNKLSKEVTVSLALLKNSSSVPGMEDEVKRQQTKIDEIVSKVSGKKVKDMEKKDLEEHLATLATIPTEIAKRSEELAKEDTANKEVAALFIDAIKSIEAATEKDKAFSEKIKAEEETDKNWRQSAKDAIGFKKTLKKEEIKGKDKVLARIQEEIIRAFKDDIKDSEVFKKFSEGKYSGDGYFGDNTAKVIVALKKGLGMDDKTSDITEEFLDKVLSYRGKEGKNTNESLDLNIGRFKSFSFFETLNEKKKIKFDVAAFKEATGEKTGGDKKSLPSVEELESKLKKIVSETYDKHKEGIDYIMSKDFSPSEAGEKAFSGIFRSSWKAFKEFNEKQKRNTLAMGFKNVLEPTTGIDKGIGKDVIDIYLKKEGGKK